MATGWRRRTLLKGLLSLPITAPACGEFRVSREDCWRALADDVRAQMRWAWGNYTECCFGQDQIKPVSGGREPFFFPKGPPLGLTIVEALDTLYLMGLDAELENGIPVGIR